MAYTQTDLDAVDAAIIQLASSSEASVRFSDGREVTFRSALEATKVRDWIAPRVETSGRKRIRQVRLYSRKGL